MTSMDEPIVFILGAPRSGTSLLMRMLLVNQPLVGGTDAESQVYALKRKKAYLTQAALAHPYFKKLIRESDLRDLANSNNDFVQLFWSAVEFYLHQHTEKKVFMEKSPIHTLFWRQILKDYLEVQFILVERNPSATIHSMVTTRWIPIPFKGLGYNPVFKFLPYIFATLLSYEYFIEAERIKSFGNAAIVKYEEMVQKSPDDLRISFSKMLGVELSELYIERPFSPEASSRERKLHTDRIDGYKSNTPRSILWLHK